MYCYIFYSLTFFVSVSVNNDLFDDSVVVSIEVFTCGTAYSCWDESVIKYEKNSISILLALL